MRRVEEEKQPTRRADRVIDAAWRFVGSSVGLRMGPIATLVATPLLSAVKAKPGRGRVERAAPSTIRHSAPINRSGQ